MTIKQQGGVFGRNPEFYSVSVPDNGAIYAGSDQDLKIYHDGSNSYILDQGAGGLYIRGSNEIALRSQGNKNIFLGITDGAAYVYHNGGVKLATASTGVSITGNVIVASGNGIDFSATSGTGTSELFDDYEEGTYTATLTPASGSITVDANYNQLLYTKIGRTVHVQGNLRVGAISSPSGGVDLNLPFVAGGSNTSGRNVGTVGFMNLGAFDAPILLNGNQGTASAFFVSHVAGSRAAVDGSNFTASPQTILFISMTYVAA